MASYIDLRTKWNLAFSLNDRKIEMILDIDIITGLQSSTQYMTRSWKPPTPLSPKVA